MGERDNKQSKLNNFLVQGGILAFTGVLVRVLGLARRIPLTYIIGDVGNSYYSSAYEIYNIVLTLSAYGIPLSVSKLVAARGSKGEYRNAEKIFKCALIFAIVIGLISSSLVFIFADSLANLFKEPMSMLALKVLAPTLFFVAVLGVFRGYFQGMGTMIPTAFSQFIEQIVLIIVSLTCAYFFSIRGEKVGALLGNPNYKNAYGAAGATVGCSISIVVSLTFLILLYRAYRKKIRKQVFRDPSHIIDSTFSVYKTLILTILPVMFASVVNNISNFLDQYIYKNVMAKMGLDELKTVNWGIYSGKYLVLIGVPIAMANAMGASSVPTISGIMRKHEFDKAKSRIASVTRVTMMVAIPCAVGMAVLAPELMFLLFSSTNPLASNLLRVGAIGIVLFCFSTLTNSILQAMSKLSKPIIHSLIALAVHCTLLFVLLKTTNMNIYAVAFSNNIFSLIICALNLVSLYKVIGYLQEVIKTFIIPLISSGIMALVIILVNKFFGPDGFSRLMTVILILIGIVVYFAAMIILKGITKRELSAVPGGTKIAELLVKLHILK